MGRRFNWHALKAHRVYTIQEVCAALHCGTTTLQKILDEEQVPVTSDVTPALVVGADLIPALRKHSKVQAMQLGQMFCLSCKQPSFPAGGMVEDISKPHQPLLFQAICLHCCGIMCRRVAQDQRDSFLEAAQRL